jgi:hypothetical protein
MTEIDRRAFVTGLAAVAIAGVVPALPAAAAPLVRVGLPFRRSDYVPDWFEDSIMTAYNTLWHVQRHSFSEWTIRHCDTGLMFATDPRAAFDVSLARPADAPPLSLDPALLDMVGNASRYVRTSAGFAAMRRQAEGREGAFFMHFHGGHTGRPTTADAPPLPRIESFADGNV